MDDPVDQVMFNPLSGVSASLDLLQVCPGVCIQKNLLEKVLDDGVFGTTIGRNTSGGRLWRHGPLIDLRRAWLKQRERSRRQRLAQGGRDILLKVISWVKAALVTFINGGQLRD